jgi:hypothetical protein
VRRKLVHAVQGPSLHCTQLHLSAAALPALIHLKPFPGAVCIIHVSAALLQSCKCTGSLVSGCVGSC